MNLESVESINLDINEEEDSVEPLTIQDASANDNTKTSGNNKRKRRLKSKWWQYFDILPSKEGETLRCKCKSCGKTYGAESSMGTGNLRCHVLNQCPRRNTRDIAQALLEQGEKGLVTRSQTFNQERFRELLVLAIIKHELPFQFVEYEGIRAVFSYLKPHAHISRNTAKANIFKIYKRELNRLSHDLRACPGKICFTSDLWTSIATDGYLCLTAHYIDSDWLLQKRIINFSYMPPPHTGIALFEKIYTLLTDWGIEKKVFTITLDNEAANGVFIDMLKSQLSLKVSLASYGEFLHVRCCAHILNLIVQEGLKKIDNSVDKIRDSVKYVKASQVRKQKFLECVTQTSLDSGKALRQDVPTRWNSTYLMLSHALYYRRAFNHLRLTDSDFTHCPSTDEWGKVEKICKFLQVFYDVTNVFSGVKNPTTNLYFVRVFVIQLTLSKELKSSDDFTRQMASLMFEKFDKYWKEYNILLAIAVVFDPRYKMQFVEFCYNKLYGVESLECNRIKCKMVSLFGEYMCKSSKPTAMSASSSNTGGTFDDNISVGQGLGVDVLKEFDSFESVEHDNSAQKSQLELYLDEPKIDRNAKLDVLNFWKAHQFRYPELAQMARDVLSVPISTVASESAFSTGGRIIDQYRSALKPNVVEALVCCRDWLFGQKEIVDMDLEELTENIISFNQHECESKASTIATDSSNFSMNES